MLKLFEESVIEEDISKSVQRYQLSIQEAKLRLNFAIAPGIWLMPSNLIINTESVIGYNNFLLKANSKMIFGENNLLNKSEKNVGLNHNLGESKILFPHSISRGNIIEDKNEDFMKKRENKEPDLIPEKISNPKSKNLKSHDSNIILITILMAGLGFYLFR